MCGHGKTYQEALKCALGGWYEVESVKLPSTHFEVMQTSCLCGHVTHNKINNESWKAKIGLKRCDTMKIYSKTPTLLK